MLSYLDASLAFLGARQPLLVTSTRRHCVLTCVRHAVLSVFVSGAGVHSGSAVRLDVEDDRRADAREGRQVGHAAGLLLFQSVVMCMLLLLWLKCCDEDGVIDGFDCQWLTVRCCPLASRVVRC